MAPVPRGCAALVCIALVCIAALASCSSSGTGESGSTTPSAVTPLTTASPERVRVVGAQHIAILRRVLGAERAACGTGGIAPAPTTRALVFLRPAPELEPIVADTIDALRPVIDTVRVYPKAECLGATAPTEAVRVTRCAPAGREVAEVVVLLETQLERWKTELGVGK